MTTSVFIFDWIFSIPVANKDNHKVTDELEIRLNRPGTAELAALVRL